MRDEEQEQITAIGRGVLSRRLEYYIVAMPPQEKPRAAEDGHARVDYIDVLRRARPDNCADE